MVDAADILALAPVADTVAVDALVRSIRARQRLLAAAVCRGGHRHVLTSKELWVASGGTAHVEASKDQLAGAVTMAGEGGEGGGVDVAILAFSGLEPAHPFPAAEGLTLARAINELAGQPPDGPASLLSDAVGSSDALPRGAH